MLFHESILLYPLSKRNFPILEVLAFLITTLSTLHHCKGCRCMCYAAMSPECTCRNYHLSIMHVRVAYCSLQVQQTYVQMYLLVQGCSVLRVCVLQD